MIGLGDKMTKNEVIAIAVEREGLRGARFVLRGREGWMRIAGGFWPFEQPRDSEEDAPESNGATVVEEDRPMARAAAAARAALGGNQIALSLPLSRLLTRNLRLPVDIKEELSNAVELQMDKLSPFPDEELAVGYEVLSENENELSVLAAAAPEAVYGEIGAALESAGLQVTRTDATVMGWLRSLYGVLNLSRPGRRLMLADTDDGWDLLVLEHGAPLLARGLGAQPDDKALLREITLSLLNIELEAGSAPLEDLILISTHKPEATLITELETLTNVPAQHIEPPDADGGVNGVALRATENAGLDLTPQTWRNALQEYKTRRKVLMGVGFAVAVWAILVGVMFSGPAIYRHLTTRARTASRAHYKTYKTVADTRDRVNLILSYTDRAKSPLEMLRLSSAYLPQGITLIGFNYKREDGVRISGEADQAQQVYEFKDIVTDDPLFESVTLTGPSASRGKHKFDVDAKFVGTTKP